MNGKIVLAAAAVWFAAGLVYGQGDAPPRSEGFRTLKEVGAWGVGEESAVAPPATQTGEDVEVLRRILNRELAEAYGFQQVVGDGRWPRDSDPNRTLLEYSAFEQRVNLNPFWEVRSHAGGHHTLTGAEGVYLKGHGVVFSVTLPAPTQDPVKESARPPARARTRWEQVRGELRGEKAEPDAKDRAAERPSLAEAVLRVLAENGHNFAQLAADEKITVAVTFRGDPNCTVCHDTGWSRSSRTSGPRSGSAPSTVGTSGAGTGTTNWTKDAEQAYKAQVVEAQSALLLGDLQAKQNNHKAAAAEYQKAINTFHKAQESRKETAPGGGRDAATLLLAVEMYTKLAKAHDGAGQIEQAMRALGVVEDYVREMKQAGGAQEPKKAAGVRLPGKLIVSAPKKLLDQAGTGKISFEEFRKAASVEYQAPPAQEPAAPPKQPSSGR